MVHAAQGVEHNTHYLDDFAAIALGSEICVRNPLTLKVARLWGMTQAKLFPTVRLGMTPWQSCILQ